MKKSSLAVVLASSFALVSGSAFARTRHAAKRAASTDTPVETHMAAPEHHAGNGIAGLGLGVSSISPIPFTTSALSGSLTGFLNLSNGDAIQVFAAIPSTSGTFQFGVAGMYKHTLFGGKNGGLHIGGGAGIGTNGDFAMNFNGVIGVHYMPTSNIALHLDGGPVLSIYKTSITSTTTGTSTSSTSTNFALGSFSNILGASIAYMF